MIDFLFTIVNTIAGLIIAGVGVTIILTGFKIMFTGIGWVF